MEKRIYEHDIFRHGTKMRISSWHFASEFFCQGHSRQNLVIGVLTIEAYENHSQTVNHKKSQVTTSDNKLFV